MTSHRTTHGATGTPEYRAWSGLRGRCCCPSNRAFPNYGGRGIKVCERWLHSFENFLADLGPKPTPLHSIDRIDNDGNYEPGNVRWATRTQQQRNTRMCRIVEFNGVRQTAAEWAEQLGIRRHSFIRRLNTMTVEKAITTPAPRPTTRRGHRRGVDSHLAKLDDSKVKVIRRRVANGETAVAVAKDYAMHPEVIRKIVRRVLWKHVV